jgi:hypothetical protein
MKVLEWLELNVFGRQLRVQVEELRSKQAQQERELVEFAKLINSKIHKYECIICDEEFAALPGQSPKRCGACMREIRETSGLSNGNGQHRQAGHSTRGVHKNHPAGKT